VSAMIDISDGFLGDLAHICEESGVGAEIWQKRLPVSRELEQAGGLLKKTPHDFMLGASDDYELIITCAADHADSIRSALGASHEGPVTEVGRITAPDKGIFLVAPDGSKRPWRHRGGIISADDFTTNPWL
jgi:thiamine-monophosphate kinase